MRLIDADIMKNFVDDLYHCDNRADIIKRIIDQQPTAFDKEKVLSQISLKASKASDKAWEDVTQYDYWDGVEDGLDAAYNIVENGGVDG